MSEETKKPINKLNESLELERHLTFKDRQNIALEIERLNNIITKFENYIENDIKKLDSKRLNATSTTTKTYYGDELTYRRYLNKLKELKGSDKE